MTTGSQMARARKGRVLNEKEIDRALTYLGRGLTQAEARKKLRVSQSTWMNTLEATPGFRTACDVIFANRLKEVEVTAYQLALGGSKTVKLVYVAQFDATGNPVKDETGRQKMHLSKREVTISPPDWRAVEFILRARMPEVWSTKALAHEHNVESLDTVRALLEGKVKELEARQQQPITVHVSEAHVSVPAQPPQQIGPQ